MVTSMRSVVLLLLGVLAGMLAGIGEWSGWVFWISCWVALGLSYGYVEFVLLVDWCSGYNYGLCGVGGWLIPDVVSIYVSWSGAGWWYYLFTTVFMLGLFGWLFG